MTALLSEFAEPSAHYPARAGSGNAESLYASRPATQPHLKQAAYRATDRVAAEAIRQRPTTEERGKEIGRRRTWAGGGNMPPALSAGYSEAERAADCISLQA